MKGRKWVLVLLFLAIAVFAGSYTAVRFLHLDIKARDYINKTVSGYLGGDFESSSVYILPWSFGLREAKLRLQDAPIKIEVKRIRIEFNIITLLKNNSYNILQRIIQKHCRRIYFCICRNYILSEICEVIILL